ncbi:hypothetical protein QFC21_005021 [Naganishia friedmannii]|uniref:Uncharacterized protein n=1 Tax=Naganishia friedmannii TaxID=89922 RepID=A0ACC2VD21_9TREE|nr:hypothetical protein QFC21_005021 [Naganishia friedmannii]
MRDDDDASSAVRASGSAGSVIQTTITGKEVAHREGYRQLDSPPKEFPPELSSISYSHSIANHSSYGQPRLAAESGRAADKSYMSPPTSPETPTKLQLNGYRREHRFTSLGGAFRPLTSSESGEKMGHTRNTSWSSSWFDGDDLVVRPRVRALGKFVKSLGSVLPQASKNAVHRLISRWPHRNENSAIAEKKHQARQNGTLPVYTRWRYKRNYRWVFLLIAFTLCFCHAIMPHIDWSLPAMPGLPTLHHGTEFHFTQRRLAGSPRETMAEKPHGGYKQRIQQRLHKKLNLLATDKNPLRHEIHDGLLTVNLSLPVSAHPIKQLIRDAKDNWQAKTSRQSKTLKQAVLEYKRRHRGMLPPKGFDKWWRFVVENNVPLVDEYDSIMRDVYLFHAFAPSEMHRRINAAMELPDTFSLSIKNGNIRTRTNYADQPIEGGLERVSGQVDLLKEFGVNKWIPDCRVVYSLHDTPQSFIGFDHRADLEMHAIDREYYDPYAEELDTSEHGWDVACPYTSNTRNPALHDPDAKPLGKSFVSDVSAQFDLCKHPYNIPLHGVTAGKQPFVDGYVKPIFSLSKTSLHADILAVPVEQWIEDLPVVPWDKRTSDKLLWRGSNTGTHYAKDKSWHNSQRVRAVNLTRPDAEGLVSVLPPAFHPLKKQPLKEAASYQPLQDINKRMFDVSFAGYPIQCNIEDRTCEELEESFDFKKQTMTFEEALNYKYVLDIDGNSWSARFGRLLAGGSLVFKSTIMPEWWSDRIQPWIHYVPLQLDYSDLHDALTFFQGDENGENGNDRLASEMAASGRIWFKTHWRRVDMAAYT